MRDAKREIKVLVVGMHGRILQYSTLTGLRMKVIYEGLSGLTQHCMSFLLRAVNMFATCNM